MYVCVPLGNHISQISPKERGRWRERGGREKEVAQVYQTYYGDWYPLSDHTTFNIAS